MSGCWGDPMERLRRKAFERLRAGCLRPAEIPGFRLGYFCQDEMP
jgi:hypothetical protein